MGAGINEGLADCGSASNSTYTNRLCRCDACRAAHAKAARDRKRRRLYGRELFVDAEPVRERLRLLYSMGYSERELARMGIPKSAQGAVCRAHQRTGKPVTRCTRELAERVMAVSGRALSDGQRVPAAPARALVAAWVRDGLTVAAIHRATGVSLATLREVAGGRRRKVAWRTLRALLDHRDELDMARPRVPLRELAQTVVATDKFGNDSAAMGAAKWAAMVGVDVRLVLVALRSGAAVAGHRLRAATDGDLARAPRRGWVCYAGDVPIAAARTKAELAEALGTTVGTVECYASPSHGAKSGRRGRIVERVTLDG